MFGLELEALCSKSHQFPTNCVLIASCFWWCRVSFECDRVYQPPAATTTTINVMLAGLSAMAQIEVNVVVHVTLDLRAKLRLRGDATASMLALKQQIKVHA